MPNLIKITVNGAEKRLQLGTTVEGLIALLGLSGHVAVERNREVVPRAAHATVVLADGDRLEVVTFVGGG